MKTKMPDVVYLFPTLYEVGDMLRHVDEGYVGKADHSERQIRIDATVHMEEQKSVMLHEIVHCILTQAGYKDQDEQMMDILANGFLNIIRGNKDLVRWLEEVG